MKGNQPLISVIVPMRNEAENINDLYSQLMAVFSPLPYDAEYIFIDDGSTDTSANVIRKISENDSAVHLIQLSRNFGKEIATTAGIHAAKGDAALLIDADLQHPPHYIPQFIAAWEAGHDVVIGVRSSKDYASIFKRLTSKAFYTLVNAISTVDVVPSATDFRLIDRQVIDAFRQLTERNRLTRGLIDWLGFDRTYIEFTASKRLHGARAYTYRKLLRLAVNTIVSLSYAPLKFIGYAGALMTGVSGIWGIVLAADRLIGGHYVSSSRFIALLIVFVGGLILSAIGILSLYIANMYDESTNRPLYIEKHPRSHYGNR